MNTAPSGERPSPPTREAEPAGQTRRGSTDEPDLSADLLAELGLLPSPEILARYQIAVPDVPGVIIGWIDAQVMQRLELERASAVALDKYRTRGQFLSAAIAGTGLVCAATVGVLGNPVVASIIAIASIGGPTTAIALARMVPAGRAAASGPNHDGR